MATLGGVCTTGLVALAALLTALDSLVGLGVAAWAVATAAGVAVTVTVAGSSTRDDRLGPADLVTLARALLACGVAALVTDGLLGGTSTGLLVAVAVVALVLDAVDGRVARRTGTTSAFGSRFDGEADAFLILVLSVHVGALLGWWVLAIGAARYVFGLAAVVLPWMAARLPFRYWRKVVTAVQGIVLTVAAADVLPPAAASLAVVAALALLAESFGRDVVWLWRRRGAAHWEGATATAVGAALDAT
jgi:phosphatidylglycerophosphate synthase